MFLAQTFGNNSDIEFKKMTCFWVIMNYFLFQNVCAFEVRVSLLCMCSQRRVSLIHLCQPAQPDVYSLTHHLFLPFHHLLKTRCCCVCCKWGEKQAESIHFCHVLSTQLSSISKAINSTETPVKEKHARRILLHQRWAN